MVYQIVGLGDNDDETEFSSAQFSDATTAVAPFDARATPQNLALVDESDSLSPVLDAKVLDMIGEDTPQVYALCGRGARSTFRIMRYGLEVTPLMATELPAHPIAVWTVKQRLSGARALQTALPNR